jgi:hypothetical protein
MLENPSETNEENLNGESAGSTSEDAADTKAIEGNTQKSDSTKNEESDLSDADVYYDIDGEEVSAADVKKWKAGHLMQSDYTKKTQTLSEERKAFEAKRDELEQKVSLFQDVEKEVESLILGDLKNVDMNQLRQYDTAEYLRMKEQIEERKQTLSKIAQKRAEMENKLLGEGYQQLHNALGWDDSEKQKADKDALLTYVKSAGITEREFAKVTNPKIIIAMLDAQKYQKLQQDKASITKRVLKAPKTSKPSKSQEKPQVLSLAERMYGKSN